MEKSKGLRLAIISLIYIATIIFTANEKSTPTEMMNSCWVGAIVFAKGVSLCMHDSHHDKNESMSED